MLLILQSDPLHLVREVVHEVLHLAVASNPTVAPLNMLDQRAQHRVLCLAGAQWAAIDRRCMFRARQMHIQRLQCRELPIAQITLIPGTIPGPHRRAVLRFWRRVARARPVFEQTLRVGDEVLAVIAHDEVVHLLTRDTRRTCAGLGMQDKRGNADERLRAPVATADAVDYARLVRGRFTVLLEIGLAPEEAVTVSAIVVRAFFVREEFTFSLEEAVTAPADVVIFLPVLEQIVKVVKENGAESTIRMVTALDVVLAQALGAVERLGRQGMFVRMIDG